MKKTCENKRDRRDGISRRRGVKELKKFRKRRDEIRGKAQKIRG